MGALAEFVGKKKMKAMRSAGIPRVVRRTDDFRRIEGVPRRETYPDYSEVLTEWLKMPDGQMSLRKEQAWALTEMYEVGGLLGSLGVGSGKTLISLLAPVVMEAERPVLIVPASVRDEKTLKVDIPQLSKHWKLHPRFLQAYFNPKEFRKRCILSYEELSREGQADIFSKIVPDLIILDECHRVKNKKSAVWKRLNRWFAEHPKTKMVALSGTITARSLRDYAHISALALKDLSPLPHRWMDLEDWADCLDEGIDEEARPDPGALTIFCKPTETHREGFRRRLVETPGYVSTADPDVSASLTIREMPVDVPQPIQEAFEKMRDTWETPSGDLIMTGIEFAAHIAELVNGFYYRWQWPNDVVDYEWLDARKAWRKFVRETIKKSGTAAVLGYHYDTEQQVASAVLSGKLPCPDQEYQNWRAIRKRVSPETEAVWVSEYMVDVAVQWLQRPHGPHEAGIVWTEHRALLEKLRERIAPLGLRAYGAGEQDIIFETKSCVASIDAHGEGKNLQEHHARMLYLAIPATPKTWEQSLGRCHRQGVKADEVEVEVVLACAETWMSFERARRGATYIEQTTGQRQRLNYVPIFVSDEKTVIDRATAADPLWCTEWKKNS